MHRPSHGAVDTVVQHARVDECADARKRRRRGARLGLQRLRHKARHLLDGRQAVQPQRLQEGKGQAHRMQGHAPSQLLQRLHKRFERRTSWLGPLAHVARRSLCVLPSNTALERALRRRAAAHAHKDEIVRWHKRSAAIGRACKFFGKRRGLLSQRHRRLHHRCVQVEPAKSYAVFNNRRSHNLCKRNKRRGRGRRRFQPHPSKHARVSADLLAACSGKLQHQVHGARVGLRCHAGKRGAHNPRQHAVQRAKPQPAAGLAKQSRGNALQPRRLQLPRNGRTVELDRVEGRTRRAAHQRVRAFGRPRQPVQLGRVPPRGLPRNDDRSKRVPEGVQRIGRQRTNRKPACGDAVVLGRNRSPACEHCNLRQAPQRCHIRRGKLSIGRQRCLRRFRHSVQAERRRHVEFKQLQRAEECDEPVQSPIAISIKLAQRSVRQRQPVVCAVQARGVERSAVACRQELYHRIFDVLCVF